MPGSQSRGRRLPSGMGEGPVSCALVPPSGVLLGSGRPGIQRAGGKGHFEPRRRWPAVSSQKGHVTHKVRVTQDWVGICRRLSLCGLLMVIVPEMFLCV